MEEAVIKNHAEKLEGLLTLICDRFKPGQCYLSRTIRDSIYEENNFPSFFISSNGKGRVKIVGEYIKERANYTLFDIEITPSQDTGNNLEIRVDGLGLKQSTLTDFLLELYKQRPRTLFEKTDSYYEVNIIWHILRAIPVVLNKHVDKDKINVIEEIYRSLISTSSRE